MPVDESLFQVSAVAGSIREIMRFLHTVTLFLALISIPVVFLGKRLWGNGKPAVALPVLPLNICIYFTLIYMVFAPWPRYRIPLRPGLYLCAMWAMTYFTRILAQIRRKKTEAGIIL